MTLMQFIWFQLKFQLWFQLFPSEKNPNQGRTTRSSCGPGLRGLKSSVYIQLRLPGTTTRSRQRSKVRLWSVYGPFPSLKHGL